MTDATLLTLGRLTINGAVTIALAWFLVWYEVHRKWNKDELAPSGMAALWIPIVRYRVALIVAGVLIPKWMDWLPKLLGAGG